MSAVGINRNSKKPNEIGGIHKTRQTTFLLLGQYLKRLFEIDFRSEGIH